MRQVVWETREEIKQRRDYAGPAGHVKEIWAILAKVEPLKHYTGEWHDWFYTLAMRRG